MGQGTRIIKAEAVDRIAVIADLLHGDQCLGTVGDEARIMIQGQVGFMNQQEIMTIRLSGDVILHGCKDVRGDSIRFNKIKDNLIDAVRRVER